MKKSVLAVACAVVLLLGLTSMSVMQSEASEIKSYEDSYLTQEIESTGKMILRTRGIYMQSGSTTVAKAGKGLLVAAGETMGQQVVERIQVSVIVEQWNASTSHWEQCHSWDASETNSGSVYTSRTLKVPRGYYYRVRGIHIANSDSGYSYTDGIWFG